MTTHRVCIECSGEKPIGAFYVLTNDTPDNTCIDCRIRIEIADRNASKRWRHKIRREKVKAMKGGAK